MVLRSPHTSIYTSALFFLVATWLSMAWAPVFLLPSPLTKHASDPPEQVTVQGQDCLNSHAAKAMYPHLRKESKKPQTPKPTCTSTCKAPPGRARVLGRPTENCRSSLVGLSPSTETGFPRASSLPSRGRGIYLLLPNDGLFLPCLSYTSVQFLPCPRYGVHL